MMRKLMCQHEILLKTDLIMIRADEMLSNVQKAELNSKKRKNKNETLKKSSKTQSNNIIIIMINELIKKMKALTLQIIIISEMIIN